MGDRMKKVQPGDPLQIRAETFNTFIDAARDFKARQHDVVSQATPAFRQSGIVLIKNNSGYDCQRFDVLGIDTPIITPYDNFEEFKNRPALTCSTPDYSKHVGRFVVLLEPIAAGKLGYAVVSGITVAKINVSAECHAYADIQPSGRNYLASGQHGAAIILWKESGTGTKWALVKIGLPQLVRRFELKTELTPGGVAEAYLLDFTGADYTINPDVVFYVHDSRGLYRGWPRIDSPLRPGAWGEAIFRHDKAAWEIFDMQKIARAITFTTAEHMGATNPGEALVIVNDFYQGADPTLVYGAVKVYDPQNLFPRALAGAKGKAVLDDRGLLEQYHVVECQQMATMIKCTVYGDAGPEDPILIDPVSIELMQPIGGQNPVGIAGIDRTEGLVNTFGDSVKNGDTLIGGWNEEEDQWEVLEVKRGGGGTYAGVHETDRYLFDTNEYVSVHWENRELYADDGTTVVANWNDQHLVDDNGNLSVHWTDRQLLDYSGGTAVVDWNAMYLNDSSGYNSVDWANRYLFDSAGATVVDWASQILQDTSAYTSVDWENRTLLDSSANTVLDWSSQVLYDYSYVSSLDWTYRTLLDSSGVTVADWSGQTLYDNNNTESLGWTARQLYSFDGSTVVIDWGNLGSYGTPTINGTYTGGLYDSYYNLIADVENGLIINVYYY